MNKTRQKCVKKKTSNQCACHYEAVYTIYTIYMYIQNLNDHLITFDGYFQ